MHFSPSNYFMFPLNECFSDFHLSPPQTNCMRVQGNGPNGVKWMNAHPSKFAKKEKKKRIVFFFENWN